jgi:signal transduction histidine kinase
MAMLREHVQLRRRIALLGALVFLIPFGLYMALVSRVDLAELRIVLLYASPFLALGVLLVALAWNYAMNSIERLTGELYDALRVAQDRERERDQAHRELAERFEQERELARQKEQFHAQLAEYEKYAALAQLALGAAHEINNPLLGILSHLELEHRTSVSEEDRQEIRQCIEGAKRIAFTVRSLLNYARPGPLQLTRVNLERLINDSLAFLRHQPLFRGIQLELKMDPDAPVITADANQVSQILTNLLLNAAEATPQGGSITVVVEKVKFEDRVCIRVTDTGSGIPADVLPHIFEPFYTTKRGKGTGLGLSITQAYLRSHGGDVQVESLPSRGTTVSVILPVRQVSQPVPETEEVIVQ